MIEVKKDERSFCAPLEGFGCGGEGRAADLTALFELAPPTPQAVLIAEDPFGPMRQWNAVRLGAG